MKWNVSGPFPFDPDLLVSQAGISKLAEGFRFEQRFRNVSVDKPMSIVSLHSYA